MRKKYSNLFIVLLLVFSMISIGLYSITQLGASTSGITGKLGESALSTSAWSRPTVVSDMKPWWNANSSDNPDIAVDSNGDIHIVWQDQTPGPWSGGENDDEIMYAKYTSGVGWSNATVISDRVPYWNDGGSNRPKIAIDNNDIIHVVWSDQTEGVWYDLPNDGEIMYANYTATTGWSNATVISDNGNWWNTNESYSPHIAIDSNNNIHVVWEDNTPGVWGTDTEIMYTNYTSATGWSNATVISDNGNWWNIAESYDPEIAITGTGIIYVVWQDDTNGSWGYDWEIMCANYTSATGWSNATVISDNGNWWNTGDSTDPVIAIDDSNKVHIAWEDETLGPWGGGESIDEEIMYACYTPNLSWSNATLISDNGNWWNTGESNDPAIAVKGNSIHVVWEDETFATPGAPSYLHDEEIMYSSFTSTTGWSNATIVSDDDTEWNIGRSSDPRIAVAGNKLYVVWEDDTLGPWSAQEDDEEIMVSYIELPSGGIPGFPIFACIAAILLLGLVVILMNQKKQFKF